MTETCAYPLSVETGPERSLNIKNFISNYKRDVGAGVALRNHTGVIAYFSDDFQIEERADDICFFLDPPPDELCEDDEKSYRKGRALIEEVVYLSAQEATLKPILSRDRLRLLMAPTALDMSDYDDGSAYQKGADTIIVYRDEGMVATDVTTCNSKLCLKRQKAGVNAQAAMPVIVVSSEDLSYHDNISGKRYSHIHYLDNKVREAVARFGYYPPFYGLGLEDIIAWQKKILRMNIEGVGECRLSIRDHLGPEAVISADMPVIQSKLDYFGGAIRDQLYELNELYPDVRI